MKYLWNHLDEITQALIGRQPKVLLLDFDGTLVPIANSPQKARLLPKSRSLLKKISQKPGFYLAIISGRQLNDLKEKIRIPNIIFGGNHGLQGEIFTKNYSFPIPDQTLETLQSIREQLNIVTDKFKGLLIEDKGSTLSFHYRLADKHQVAVIKFSINQILKPYIKNKTISIIPGKKVINILPKTDWNKGLFADFLIKKIASQTKTDPVVIAIGDDITDEEMFRRQSDGITIKVGAANKSVARYFLKDEKEVLRFLNWILQIASK